MDSEWKLVAYGCSPCDDGKCPEIRERGDGWGRVRGIDPTDPAGVREIDVLIPPEPWARMRAQLRA